MSRRPWASAVDRIGSIAYRTEAGLMSVFARLEGETSENVSDFATIVKVAVVVDWTGLMPVEN